MGKEQTYRGASYKGMGLRHDDKEWQLRSDQYSAKKSLRSQEENSSIVYLPKEDCLYGGEGTYASILFKDSLAEAIKPHMIPHCDILELMPTRNVLQFIEHQLHGSLKELKLWGFSEPLPENYNPRQFGSVFEYMESEVMQKFKSPFLSSP